MIIGRFRFERTDKVRDDLPMKFVIALLLSMVGTTQALANERVAVVVGANAPPIEKHAAGELCQYLNKLFGIEVAPTAEVVGADNIFLVGSPATNEQIPKEDFPDVSDQGIAIKPAKLDAHSALIVGGGSPKATLWAVYALAEHWGVRFLLHGDVLPARREFAMPTIEIREEPKLRV